jgi:tetraacyldisaccharide 4'-kinase
VTACGNHPLVIGGGVGIPPLYALTKALLAAGKQPAVLSRGYKRKLKGFQLLPADSSAALYGDEPVQIAHKFPEVPVAVDKDRVHGCGQLASKASCIVLDDAFQYRRLRATLNLVLVDFHRPIFKDQLLPWGRLRDLPGRLKAAQVVIVTKCPAELSAQEREAWQKDLHLSPEQQLFFTTLQYGTPLPVFPEADKHYLYAKQSTVLTGIANDAPLRSYLSDTYKIGQHLQFPDHHAYSKADLRTITRAIQASATSCLFTTEKDAQRLRDCKNVPEAVRRRLFYVPVEAAFLTPEEEETFSHILLAAL